MKEGKKVDKIKALYCDEDGTTTVEYALLLVVMVGGAVPIWMALRDRIANIVSTAASELQ